MWLIHIVIFLCSESIPQFLRDAVAQVSRGQHLHVWHPGEDPPHKLLAPCGFQPHLDAAVLVRPKFLRQMLLPLGLWIRRAVKPVLLFATG